MSRTYKAFLFILTKYERHDIMAKNRAEAVYKASQLFWELKKETPGAGSVEEEVRVADPYKEVLYDKDTFRCTDRRNRLLTLAVMDKLIQQADGDLVEDGECSVKRAKRRRKQGFGEFIAPNIKSQVGKLYYRVVIQPQKSKGGKIIQQRKYKDILLTAGDLKLARQEIIERGLDKEANEKIGLFRKSRQLRGSKEATLVRKAKKPALSREKPKTAINALPSALHAKALEQLKMLKEKGQVAYQK